MSKCSHNREVLDLYIVGLAGLEDLDDDHAGRCAGCREALAEAHQLREALTGYAREAAREADEILTAEESRPAAPTSSGRLRLRHGLLAAAAAVAFVAVGLVVFLRQPPVPTPPPTDGLRQQYLSRVQLEAERGQLASYLEESQGLFLSLLYGATDCAEGRVEVGAERALARELLRRKRVLEPELARPTAVDVRPVFDELELLLLEVAAGEECIPAEQIASLKEIVEARRTLQRLRLLRMEGRI